MNSYKFEDIKVGLTESFQVTITNSEMEKFLAISNDVNPLHNDSNYAKEKGYPDRVVFGMLTASYLSTLAGVYLPGQYSLIYRVSTDFVKPVFIGDKLTITGEVKDVNELFKVFNMKVTIKNQNDELVLRGKMEVGFKQ